MIRQKISGLITNPKFYKKIEKLGYLVAFLSWLAIPFIPLFGEKVFISENALNPNNPRPLYDQKLVLDHMKYLQNVNYTQEESTISYIEQVMLNYNIQPRRQYFQVRLADINEDSYFTGVNVYGIYRTKRAETGECNLISFDHNLAHKNGTGKLEIAFVLSFLDMLMKHHDKINYMSRDIIFLAYDGRYKYYGKSVNEFLDAYYNDKTLNFERCGTIRQAINIEITDDSFNRVALLFQGINARIPDHDYYVSFVEMLDKHMRDKGPLWTIDDNMNHERAIQKVFSKYYYSPILKFARDNFKIFFPDVDATYFLNSVKNYALGRHHEAHGHYMEKGIPAVTLKGYKCATCLAKNPEDMLGMLGRVVEANNRANMALQEQLHAGSRAYIVLSNKYFIMIGKYILFLLPIPIALLIRGLVLYYSQPEEDKKFRVIVVRYLAQFLSLYIIFHAHKLVEGIYYLIFRKDLQLCYNGQDPDIFATYSSMMTLTYIWFALLGYGALSKLIHILLKKMTPDIDYPQAGSQMWRSYYLFQAAYVGLSMIGWAFVNVGLTIFAVFCICPIFFFIIPCNSWKSYLPRFLFVISWIGVLIWAFYALEIGGGVGGLEIVKWLVVPQWCYGSDAHKFVYFFIVPCLQFLKDILLYVRD